MHSLDALPSDKDQLIKTIRFSVIGRDRAIPTPFGYRRITYADYTASGRSLSFLEELIQGHVMPLYANTHTEASGTGCEMSMLREQARKLIAKAVHAGPDDLVIFTGSGATSAIVTCVDALNLRLPPLLNERYGFDAAIPEEDRPVVFTGPYEHHSNVLPWRESIAQVLTVEENADGHVDLDHLERLLQQYENRSLKIGAFSAASNVTGITTDTVALAALLHRYGALALFDYAAAAPYVAIDMHPQASGELQGLNAGKDAVFISPHKFVGGPQTPGILVINKALFRSKVPVRPGGGTVKYVSPDDHDYIGDITHREEGGTPGIIESIRAGLVFQLKEAVGIPVIHQKEQTFLKRALQSLTSEPHIEILGNTKEERLCIISFLLKPGRYLHHNFVVRLLNDLFGIQARGGCSCAGPYGHRLLKIDKETSLKFRRVIDMGYEGIKPGWVRVNFNYFIGETEFSFILKALSFVARHGKAFLPLYAFDVYTGLWRHRDESKTPAPCLFDRIDYACGQLEYCKIAANATETELDQYLEHAEEILARLQGLTPAMEKLPPEVEELRWFEIAGA